MQLQAAKPPFSLTKRVRCSTLMSLTLRRPRDALGVVILSFYVYLWGCDMTTEGLEPYNESCTTCCGCIRILNCCFLTWKVPQCSPSGTTDHGLLLKDNPINRCGTQWQIQVYLTCLLAWEVSVVDVILPSIKFNIKRPCPKLRLKF